MTKQSFFRLCIALVILGGLYFLISSRDRASNQQTASDIFAGISGTNIARLRIEQGEQVVELATKDGQWTIPARGDYPADAAKVRSLLLKLFDLSQAEPMPSSAEAFDKLGLSDEAIKKGKTKVMFYGADGKELSGIRLGEERKGRTDGPPAMGRSGQYIRRSDGNQVFLLPLPVTVSASLSYWFEPTVLSVLQSSVRAVTQTSLANNSETPVFDLQRENPDEAKLQVGGEVPAGKKVSDAVLGEVSSGLENLRLDDVFRADSTEVKDLVFDRRTVYRATNGLVYELQSAERGEKIYAKLSVSFDSEFAKAKQAEAAAATPTPSPSSTPAPDATPTPQPTPAKPAVTMADENEAEKHNSRLKPWIFELPAYQAKKLRHTRDELFEEIKPPATPSPAPAG